MTISISRSLGLVSCALQTMRQLYIASIYTPHSGNLYHREQYSLQSCSRCFLSGKVLPVCCMVLPRLVGSRGHSGYDPEVVDRLQTPICASSRMSSPHSGRILALPLIWSRGGEHSSSSELPAGPHPSDEELMARLGSRDCSALDALFKRYSRLVFGIALRTLGNRVEAEDIVHDVFFYMYQKPALFDPTKGSAKSWIVQIAFTRALDRRAHLSRSGYYSGTNFHILAVTLVGINYMEQDIQH